MDFLLGQYRIRPGQNLIESANGSVKIYPKAMDVLLYLAKAPGVVRLKEEIISAVWSETHVTDEVLSNAIWELRRALGDDPRAPRYIQTISRKGYVLISEVLLPREPVPIASPATDNQSRPGICHVAVLPFANFSGGVALDSFCDGLAEEVINALSQGEGRRVVARTSSFYFKGKHQDVREIGRQLGACHVLEGSVREQGDLLRITAQLIDVSSGYHLWSKSITVSREDTLTAHDLATSAIVEKFDQTECSSNNRPSVDSRHSESALLYLRGRHHLRSATPRGFERAIYYMERVVRCEPDWALPHAALAHARALLGTTTWHPPRECFGPAKESALRALTLNPDLAEAHAVLVLTSLHGDWDWITAELHFMRAQELCPSDITARRWYALSLQARGRHDEALAHARQCLESDPLSATSHYVVALLLYLARRLDESFDAAKRGLELEGRHVFLNRLLGLLYAAKGNAAAFLRIMQDGLLVTGRLPIMLAGLGRAYAFGGDREKALAIVAELEDIARRVYVPFYHVGAIHAVLGEMERAFACLERAFLDRSLFMVYLGSDPVWEPIRSEPRFLDLMHRTNLDVR